MRICSLRVSLRILNYSITHNINIIVNIYIIMTTLKISTNIFWKINLSDDNIQIECGCEYFNKIYRCIINQNDPIFTGNTLCNSIVILNKFLSDLSNQTHANNVHIGFSDEKILLKICGLIDSFTIEIPSVENLICTKIITYCTHNLNNIPKQLTTTQTTELSTKLNTYNTTQLNGIWQLLSLVSDIPMEQCEFTGESKASLKKYASLIIKRNIPFGIIKDLIKFSENNTYVCSCSCGHKFLSNDNDTIKFIEQHNETYKDYIREHFVGNLIECHCPICKLIIYMHITENVFVNGF